MGGGVAVARVRASSSVPGGGPNPGLLGLLMKQEWPNFRTEERDMGLVGTETPPSLSLCGSC